MRLHATDPRGVTLTPLVPVTTLGSTPVLEMPGWFRRVAGHVGDLAALVGIVFCIPFVIMAIGLPIALALRFVLRIVGGL